MRVSHTFSNTLLILSYAPIWLYIKKRIELVCVWIHWSCCVSRLRFSFLFLFFFVTLKRYCSSLLWTVAVTFDREQCICALFMDPQITLFSNFFIKNGSHGTIYTFKNYFATVFSVFNFQLQQNKFYPNRPLVFGLKKRR